MQATTSQSKKRLRGLQKRRKLWLRVVVTLAAAALFFVRSTWADDAGGMHELLEDVGLLLIGVCIIGRAWCILYIGGRKTAELVTLGPYSVMRNPLYVFSFIGAFGVGLQSGSIVIGLICLGIAAAVFVPVVLREEAELAQTYGAAFEEYRRRVPRFLPRVSAWRDAKVVAFSPVLLYSTLRDSLVFVCAYPLFELLEWAQDMGYFPILARLP